jgi:hypothetical protein
MFFLCQRSYVALMTSAVEHPDIKFVVYPVHMAGTLTGATPRMRHDPDCGHFKWGDGTVLGTAVLATEEQMRSLRACKSCIRSHRSAGDVSHSHIGNVASSSQDHSSAHRHVRKTPGSALSLTAITTCPAGCAMSSYRPASPRGSSSTTSRSPRFSE